MAEHYTEQFLYDDAYGKLYKWDSDVNGYLFVCYNPFNLTKEELIEEYEQLERFINDKCIKINYIPKQDKG